MSRSHADRHTDRLHKVPIIYWIMIDKNTTTIFHSNKEIDVTLYPPSFQYLPEAYSAFGLAADSPFPAALQSRHQQGHSQLLSPARPTDLSMAAAGQVESAGSCQAVGNRPQWRRERWWAAMGAGAAGRAAAGQTAGIGARERAG